MNGIEITDGVDISNAQDFDFVLNTNFISGMKVNEVHQFTMTNPPSLITYAHGLGYVPAVIAFQNGSPGVSWQNAIGLVFASANADATNVYIQGPNGADIFVIIFAEQVA